MFQCRDYMFISYLLSNNKFQNHSGFFALFYYISKPLQDFARPIAFNKPLLIQNNFSNFFQPVAHLLQSRKYFMHASRHSLAIRLFVDTSLCHPCYTFACVYMHRFQVHINVTRHVPGDHSISCPSHDLERTIKSDNCPSTLGGEMFPLRPSF